jgi:hypothetical protein
MFDLHHDWQSWSEAERVTVRVLAVALGLTMMVVAWAAM